MKPLLAAIVLLSTASFANADGWPSKESEHYWRQGKAEITHYKLSQSRYGELHDGEAVLIFVSEPFSRSKQVKLDDWEHAGADAVQVLKLNFAKKFVTGIYPYSLMLSTFTPVDAEHDPRTLKTSMSGQEWCGHVFDQLNLRNDRYEHAGYSYFESSGDTHNELPSTVLEDELWTRIRLTPESLPAGEFKIIPGSLISRLVHVPLKQETAKGTYFEPEYSQLQQGPHDLTIDPKKFRGYRLEYLSGYDRVLNIYFNKSFPYSIQAWDETYTDVGGKRLTTRAECNRSLTIDYWNRNKNSDRKLRQELDLRMDR